MYNSLPITKRVKMASVAKMYNEAPAKMYNEAPAKMMYGKKSSGCGCGCGK